jgi:hypothetical protein
MEHMSDTNRLSQGFVLSGGMPAAFAFQAGGARVALLCALVLSVLPEADGFTASLRPLMPRTGRRGLSSVRNRPLGVSMGVEQWRENKLANADSNLLGCLPFPLDDILLPGETKQLHLYEARFLKLFEEAMRNHGSCIGNIILSCTPPPPPALKTSGTPAGLMRSAV